MKIVFYEAKYGNWLDKFISFWTRGKYSHCELYFEDMDICFSSSSRDKGTRYKRININNGKWDIIKLNISDEEKYFNRTKAFIDKKYDWIGIIFTQLFPLNRQDKDKWFCSEICGYILGYDESYKYSPNKLFKIIMRDHIDG